jgi:putative endopeptidase
MRKHTIFAGLILLSLASCQNMNNNSAENKPARKLLDPANMDTTVKPGDNFFLYANGTWLKNNPIPGDQSRWGSFNELQENNYKALHDILESAAANKNAAAGSNEQKVGDFYKSGMDSIAADKAGITPLKDVLDRINGIKNANDLLSEVAMEQTEGIDQIYGFGVSPDDKNVTKEICQFAQGGLGLPNKNYYFDKDDRTVKIRNAYKEYIPKMLMQMGEDAAKAKKDADDIFNLESKLADASLSPVEERDPYRLYNKYNLDGITKETPGIDWKVMLTNLKIHGEDTVIINMPAFFKEVAKQLKATPIDVWKKYLSFHLVSSMAPFLGHEQYDAYFDFYGKTLSGLKEPRPRWKRVMNEIDGSIGEILGQMYVDKTFKPEAKKRMLDLVNNLQQTYAERINRLDWMSDETKKKAVAKLNAFMKKIGYPDHWKDYSSVTIVPDNYVKNIMAASVFAYNYNINKLGKPVDRTEWGMTPPTVNAYYNPGFNEIVFPAGILQYPFFDFDADDAVNYGGIGAVIGHEMTHGFDDQGRLYDANGNLNNWWTPQDSANFVMKAQKVIDEFNAIVAIDTNHINGSLTEGENLADLGGLNIAYEAYKKTKEGQSNDKIDGFTGDQRFFLSWAQVWRANTRPEEIAKRLKTDPHSPSEFRCDVPPSNMDAWYKAFNIQPGAKWYRPENERARVW